MTAPQEQDESALRETCERCGEQVVTREPGSITLTIHAHLDGAERQEATR